MKMEQFEKAQAIVDELEPLYEVGFDISEKMKDNIGFALHEKYFSAEFKNKINDQIQSYLQKKIQRLEEEFASL